MISYIKDDDDESNSGDQAEAEGILQSLSHRGGGGGGRGAQVVENRERSGSHHRRSKVYIDGGNMMIQKAMKPEMQTRKVNNRNNESEESAR
jgi:hypothetical protein